MNISVSVFVFALVLCLVLGGLLGYFFAQSRYFRSPARNAQELAAVQSTAAAATARAERLTEENNSLIDRAKSDQDILRRSLRLPSNSIP